MSLLMLCYVTEGKFFRAKSFFLTRTVFYLDFHRLIACVTTGLLFYNILNAMFKIFVDS